MAPEEPPSKGSSCGADDAGVPILYKQIAPPEQLLFSIHPTMLNVWLHLFYLVPYQLFAGVQGIIIEEIETKRVATIWIIYSILGKHNPVYPHGEAQYQGSPGA